MAHESMKKTSYWYGDEDVNAVVKHVRENSKNPNVIILDAVVADGAKYSKGDVRNLETTLNKNSRIKAGTLSVAIHAFLVFSETKEKITPEDVASFMDPSVSALSADEKAAFARFFTFSEGDSPSVVLKEVKKKFDAKVTAEIGEDFFDEIKKLLIKDSFNVRVLFPYNIVNTHWVLGEIEITKDEKGVFFFPTIHDSMGERKFTDAEIARMVRIISDRLDVKAEQGLVVAGGKPKAIQVDGSSCGPITLENLRLRAEDESVLCDTVPKGAQKLRQQQYEMVKPKSEPTASVTADIPEGGNKWQELKVQETFRETFQKVHDAKLIDHTVQTTDLSADNLEEFVKSTKELIDKLGLKGEVEVNAPPEKKQLLIQLCKKHGLTLAGETKPAPVKIESERMDKVEETSTHRTPAMAV
jgi:hypothetical protein